MITESRYWKRPLLRGATIINRYMSLECISEAQFSRVERDIFIGFFSIRKLLEATGKVGPETRTMSIPLSWYSKYQDEPIVDWYNRSEFWDLYDLEAPHLEDRDVLYVAHRIIHSFIFVLSEDERGSGVFFTSDHDKEFRLNFVSTEEVVRAFRAVGSDYPAGFQAWRDKRTGEMKWSVPPREKPVQPSSSRSRS